jgi:hypothetical protein
MTKSYILKFITFNKQDGYMFCIVKQQREVKFLLVYAGMLEHMKMPTTYFKQVSKIGGGMPPPPATVPLDVYC